jgi:hypothetical protein
MRDMGCETWDARRGMRDMGCGELGDMRWWGYRGTCDGGVLGDMRWWGRDA